MGCGESKHAVATTESISRKKSESRSNSKKSQHAGSKKGKKSSSTFSSRGPSRSASAKQMENVDSTENAEAMKEERNSGEELAKEIKVEEGIKKGNCEEKGKEIGNEGTVLAASPVEKYYSSNEASEYEASVEENGVERKEEKAEVVMEESEKAEEKQREKEVIQETKAGTENGKTETVEGAKEIVSSQEEVKAIDNEAAAGLATVEEPVPDETKAETTTETTSSSGIQDITTSEEMASCEPQVIATVEKEVCGETEIEATTIPEKADSVESEAGVVTPRNEEQKMTTETSTADLPNGDAPQSSS